MNSLKGLPSKRNVVLEHEQIERQEYAQPAALARIVGVSRSTVFRLLKTYDEDNQGVEELYISLSPTLRVISIKKFIEYMHKLHNRHLYEEA